MNNNTLAYTAARAASDYLAGEDADSFLIEDEQVITLIDATSDDLINWGGLAGRLVRSNGWS